MITIVGLIASQHNWRDLYDYLNKQENFHLDNEQDIHTGSKFYEESSYGLNLEMLTILY